MKRLLFSFLISSYCMMSRTGLLTLQTCAHTDEQSRYSVVSTCMCRCDGNMFQPCGSRCTSHLTTARTNKNTPTLRGKFHTGWVVLKEITHFVPFLLSLCIADPTFSRIASIAMLTGYLCVSLIHPLDTTMRMFILIQNLTSANSSRSYVSNFFNLWSCKNMHIYFSVLHQGQYKRSSVPVNPSIDRLNHSRRVQF